MDTESKFLDLRKVKGPNQVTLQTAIIDTYCQSHAQIGRGYRRDQMEIKHKLITSFFDRKEVT
jgi:hypothetical protein